MAGVAPAKSADSLSVLRPIPPIAPDYCRLASCSTRWMMNGLERLRLWPLASAVTVLLAAPAFAQTYGDEVDDAPTPTVARFVASDFIDDSADEVIAAEF